MMSSSRRNKPFFVPGFLLFAAGLVFVVLTAPAADALSDGMQAFDDGRYAEALSAFSTEKAQQKPPVQTRLGQLHLNGWGTEKNAAIAAVWFEKAARQGEREAAFELGRLYLDGNGVPLAPQTGLSWLNQAARTGYVPANNELGRFYKNNRDPETARFWYEKSARQNDPEGLYQLSLLLLEGTPSPGDVKKGVALTEKAARLNHPGAQFSLAEYYHYGSHVKPDTGRALFWYRRSAAQHYLPAMRELADIAEYGLMDQPEDPILARQLRAEIDTMSGTPSSGADQKIMDALLTVWDIVKPFTLLLLLLPIVYVQERKKYRTRQIQSGINLYNNGQYTMAYSFLNKPYIADYPEAQAMLGNMLACGLGVEKNVAKAMPHLTFTSGEDGYSAYRIGTLFENGDGVDPSDEQAFFWYERGAQLDDKDAMNRLGLFYALGRGTAPDPAKAVEWIEKSVDYGSFRAKIDLATLYHRGWGVKRDDPVAFELIREGANAGHATALYHLGLCYRHGYGTPKNEAKAALAFRQSANLGKADAMRELADLEAKGWPGHLPDPEKSRHWTNRANGVPTPLPSDSWLPYTD